MFFLSHVVRWILSTISWNLRWTRDQRHGHQGLCQKSQCRWLHHSDEPRRFSISRDRRLVVEPYFFWKHVGLLLFMYINPLCIPYVSNLPGHQRVLSPNFPITFTSSGYDAEVGERGVQLSGGWENSWKWVKSGAIYLGLFLFVEGHKLNVHLAQKKLQVQFYEIQVVESWWLHWKPGTKWVAREPTYLCKLLQWTPVLSEFNLLWVFCGWEQPRMKRWRKKQMKRQEETTPQMWFSINIQYPAAKERIAGWENAPFLKRCCFTICIHGERMKPTIYLSA